VRDFCLYGPIQQAKYDYALENHDLEALVAYPAT
jgi:hypothetical protein